MWNVTTSDTSNNRGNWNHLKSIQKIPEKLNGKALNQGNTEHSHAGHCTRASENSNVKYKIFVNLTTE